jgi:ureidoglycolate lyase
MTGKAGMTASARPAAASAIVLRPQALTAASFAAFGDVIETEGRESRWINDGTCRRFDDLAHVDVSEQEGHAALSIFEADVRPMPLHIRTLERHPLASQAFIPLQTQPFLVVVAEDAAGPVAARVPDAKASTTDVTCGITHSSRSRRPHAFSSSTAAEQARTAKNVPWTKACWSSCS